MSNSLETQDFVEYTEWLENQHWIKEGDCVYVVSDILDLAKAYLKRGQKLDLDKLTECLQKLVGETGTLLLPTFNWDFCKGVDFDYYKTPGRTGALPKAALKRKDFARTAHPIYSFAVWGKYKDELLQNNSIDSFGPGTIFEQMYNWNAKILVIGLTPLQSVTYVHHVEQMTGVPYRYHKEFTAGYTDADGVYEQRTYRMYVRDLDMDPQYANAFQAMSDIMQNQGLVKTGYYDGVPSHLMMITDVDAVVSKDIIENDARSLYTYKHIK